MSKHIFILLSLFILCSSQYLRPMKKDSKYGDDVCRYIEEGFVYVRPCEKGKYCLKESSEGSDLYVCQDLPEAQEALNTLDEKCSSDFDCELNLKCIGGYCKNEQCGSNQAPLKRGNSYSCISSSEKAADGICWLQQYKDNSGTISVDGSPKEGNPTGKSQKCGLLDFYDMGYQDYILNQKKYADIGSLDNGNYVTDEILCKSGFALFYYPKGNLQNPYNRGSSYTSSYNKMYKMCVTPISIEHNDPLLLSQSSQTSCVIYYKESDEDTTIKKYNVDHLYLDSHIDSTVYPSFSTSDLCKYTDYEFKIKFQHFKEYTSNLKEEQREKCGDLGDSNVNNYRRYICDNNALIKSWYFYKNPDNYIVYNERKKLEVVLDYLIQKEYPSYQFSQILNINYMLGLLFLLCL